MNNLQPSACPSAQPRNNNQRSCCGLCTLVVAAVFAFLLAAALGLIFGATYAEQIFTALPALIVFAVVAGIAALALLFWRKCEQC
jgi:hypothetical protein